MPPPAPARWRVGAAAALVPAERGIGQALLGVVAILAFLASLAAGAAEIVARTSGSWRASLSREATIQVLPADGRDMSADLDRAAALARATPGVLSATVLSPADGARLLEPWLGSGAELSDLPLPGLVTIRLATPRSNLSGLAARLLAAVPGARLDDHLGRLDRLVRAADMALLVAVGLVALVTAASGLAVAFATRGTVSAGRDAIEVLHLVGATDRFVARVFAARFARLALIGAVLGSAAAALVFGVAGHGDRDSDILIGSFGLGWFGALAIAAVAPAFAGLAGLVSAATVKRILKDQS